ncbi:hypothetical protein TCAL_03730 [Tigriopus californicus]|uniref:Uncharacterized protein n=1 Tax=Tigriopus californicus TaxID=6832 RepID=A0A553NPU8_TIGCA|nr:hypothetical protein TCAL_03730 [Tigriopus californicus]|eukprot:TCALIF_03730-PA protein Name:"Protein of unknown function" AED:0.20 eAED:0.20 QI:0/0.66/0/0.75/0.66/0.75/4/0/303
MKTTAWTKVLVVNFLSSISVIKGVLFKRTIASTFNEKEISPNSFRFDILGSICESGVVPFFSGDHDDKTPAPGPNAIHVAHGRLAKRSNLLADIFLFGPLHDSERHLLFLKDNHLHYISSIADQSTIQYEVPSPIQNARAILFRSDETIMSYSFPNRQLTSFSIFAWYHGNGMGKTSRPIVGIIGANLWNMGAQLYVGRQVEGKMALIFYTSVATIPTKTQVYSDSAIRVSNDVWNHVGVTFDASAGIIPLVLSGHDERNQINDPVFATRARSVLLEWNSIGNPPIFESDHISGCWPSLLGRI